MALDLSNVKGISDEVKAKIAKAKTREELNEVIKAEGLTEEQMKELAGGTKCPTYFNPACTAEDACFGESCKALPL